jgi:hypothetical protein
MWLEACQFVAIFMYIGWTNAYWRRECCDLFAWTPEVHMVCLAHDPETHMSHWCL